MAEKQTEGIIFENHLGIAVNNILSDGDVNKAFSEIDVNIAGVEWEEEPPGAGTSKCGNSLTAYTQQ